MPLYEYECNNCLHRFEKLQKRGEDGKFLTCPKCGEKEPRKLISGFMSRSHSCSGSTGFS